MSRLSRENYEKVKSLKNLSESMQMILADEGLHRECMVLGGASMQNPAEIFNTKAKTGLYDELKEVDYIARTSELSVISDKLFRDKSFLQTNYRDALYQLQLAMAMVAENVQRLLLLNEVSDSMQYRQVADLLNPESDCSWLYPNNTNTMTDEELAWSQKMQESGGEWL